MAAFTDPEKSSRRKVVEAFRVETGKDAERVASFLEDRLYEHNSSTIGRDDGRLFSRVVRDPSGSIVAGIAGWTWAAACEITQFWVSPSMRAKGIGTKLLQAAEEEARNNKCIRVLVKTYSFQAPTFYEKHGYKVEHVTEDFPEGHRYYTLMKAV
jgi:GNAT superfamily N-acetyltransferase